MPLLFFFPAANPQNHGLLHQVDPGRRCATLPSPPEPLRALQALHGPSLLKLPHADERPRLISHPPLPTPSEAFHINLSPSSSEVSLYTAASLSFFTDASLRFPLVSPGYVFLYIHRLLTPHRTLLNLFARLSGSLVRISIDPCVVHRHLPCPTRETPSTYRLVFLLRHSSSGFCLCLAHPLYTLLPTRSYISRHSLMSWRVFTNHQTQ